MCQKISGKFSVPKTIAPKTDLAAETVLVDVSLIVWAVDSDVTIAGDASNDPVALEICSVAGFSTANEPQDYQPWS